MEVDYLVQNLDRGSTVANQVRIAGTSSARRRGLLGVEGLEGGLGIWIAPCEAIHTFGMKMPIDVVFLDGQYRVNKLLPAMRPFRISVCLSASSVLELEAGTISRSATRLGDRLTFQAASRTGE